MQRAHELTSASILAKWAIRNNPAAKRQFLPSSPRQGAVGATPPVPQGIWVATALRIFGRTRRWHRQSAKLHTLGYSFETHLLKAGRDIRHLELHIFPWVGKLPIDSILPTEIVRCLHRIKERGHLETAQRVREVVQNIYQHAVDVGALEPAKNFVNNRTGGLPRRAVGTLVVDMFDLQSKRAVWRGTVSGTIPSSSEKLNQGVQEGITKLFEAFPPGSGVK